MLKKVGDAVKLNFGELMTLHVVSTGDVELPEGIRGKAWYHDHMLPRD